jgi:hypothetical protein
MLHAIQYFMGSLVTFTSDSAVKVYANSPNYNVPPEPFLSSRLLNRQLKFVMHRLHIEFTREVLEGLEKSLRSRTRDAWGPSFAVILVLCLCIEGLQTAADTFVVCDLIKEGQASEVRREMSAEACREVEEYPFERCKRLFHEIYKSGRVGNGGGREGGYNPLRALGDEREIEMDPPTELMARSMYSLVYNSRKSVGQVENGMNADEIIDDILQELSERPRLLNLRDEINPKDIKINSTGRLAAKFLMSFFGKES